MGIVVKYDLKILVTRRQHIGEDPDVVGRFVRYRITEA
jgi:hypothetical protein